MTLLKRKQPNNVSCTISVSIKAQIEEFRALEEVFWLAWMFWFFPYETASILELRFADRAPQRCFCRWKGIIWIQIDLNEKNVFFDFVLLAISQILHWKQHSSVKTTWFSETGGWSDGIVFVMNVDIQVI